MPNLIGQKFGKWLVLQKEKPNRYGHSKWLCRCECGKETILYGNSLTHNRSTQCHKCASWKGCGEVSGYYWTQLKNGAKKRNIKFDIQIEEAWDLFLQQDKKCALSGLDLIFAPSHRKMSTQTASLDRIDSSLGYTSDNIQWVHKEINSLKGSLAEDRLVELCELIIARRNYAT